MIGIYKITNLTNNKSYIGQSIHIEKRWEEHKKVSNNKNSKAYNYPLYRAFRKYGIKNFSFEILEECSQKELNEKEKYYISFYKSYKNGYNQNEGGNNAVHNSKLTLQEIKDIKYLIVKTNIPLTDIAKKYNIHKDTIRDINVGRSWFKENEKYPLRISKYDAQRYIKEKKYCPICGKEILKKSNKCSKCAAKDKQVPLDRMLVTREELKQMIRTIPFTKIGEKYSVTDNAVRKWCDKFNLPRKVSEIKKYSDEEWENI